MRKNSLLLAFLVLVIAACTSTKNTTNSPNSIQGEWVLTYISGPRIAFDGLYPGQKPSINFDVDGQKVFGNNSCNSYTGKLNINGDKINFKESKIAMTMMACQGNGDRVYMDMLEKIDSYTITENGKVLSFIGNSVPLMRFEKK
ncbi:MAG: META domain-containing protein [Flavobacterium sp.]|jgi:heat shock protein HslJ|nr:MAG: META domain-containing protein [Flavobacterium sp.]